jgi:molybdopterin synthase catalytic subunit
VKDGAKTVVQERVQTKAQARIVIQKAPFDMKGEYDALRSASLEVGAVTTFVGTVRDINDDDEVKTLHLEHYPGMTEKELAKILDEAAERWQIISATVIHRVGELFPGDEIVFVGIASRHRGDAFHSCEFVMDYLKTRATFWKKEKTADGDRWLSTRESDLEAAKSWQD